MQCIAGMFPEGTEIAHSVRYLDVAGGISTERVVMATRMKELRYMVKVGWVNPGFAHHLVLEEAREKEVVPEKTRTLTGTSEHAISNNAGWYHASQRGIEGMPEPVRADGRGEYALYLMQNGAGDEFRENQEVLARFFDARGALRPDMAARMKRDISLLLLPSPARALLLDKAYRVIVLAQSFTNGCDATATPAPNVHRELPVEHQPTGVRQRIVDRRQGKLAYPGR
jgi:hypothetical protein